MLRGADRKSGSMRGRPFVHDPDDGYDYDYDHDDDQTIKMSSNHEIFCAGRLKVKS